MLIQLFFIIRLLIIHFSIDKAAMFMFLQQTRIIDIVQDSCLECLLTVNDTDLCSNCDLQCCGIECQNGPNHKPEYQIFSKPLQTGCFKVKFNRPIFEVHNNYLLFLNNCNSCCKLKAIVIWSVRNDSTESSYKSCLLGHFSAMKLNNSKN